MKPTQIKHRDPKNKRLGIKSSIPKPQKAIAALYMLWKGAGEPAVLDYTDAAADDAEGLRMPPDLFERIAAYWGEIGELPSNFKESLESSALFTAQFEHLQVLFRTFWKFADFSFINSSFPDSKERTGGKRFQKKITFSSNMDVIDLIISDTSQERPSHDAQLLLLAWLNENDLDNPVSKSLKKYLTISSEDTWFKNDGVTFLQEGIYSSILDNSAPVKFKPELTGPLRILGSFIGEKLHALLKSDSTGISFKAPPDDSAKNYMRRISTYLDLIAINADEASINPSEDDELPTSNPALAHNLILYGAPGTGKSHELKERVGLLNPAEHKRVTFYSDYSYSQFVGGYKPVAVYVTSGSTIPVIKDRAANDLLRPGQPTVEYNFVSGPLLDMYVKAKNNPSQAYLLIIEELNRADAAAVFGDFFQLLDRDSSGISTYSICLNGEAQQWLQENLRNQPPDPEIRIPKNLYIWATLNSADQGVFPIDTAFKRRWSFEYLPLNKNKSIVEGLSIELATKNAAGEKMRLSWNTLREKINGKLASLGIQEDLMIGPFFLTAEEMSSDAAFKYKLIAYLRDDILRHQHDGLFSVSGTLAHILEIYDSGQNIFNFEL